MALHRDSVGLLRTTPGILAVTAALLSFCAACSREREQKTPGRVGTLPAPLPATLLATFEKQAATQSGLFREAPLLVRGTCLYAVKGKDEPDMVAVLRIERVYYGPAEFDGVLFIADCTTFEENSYLGPSHIYPPFVEGESIICSLDLNESGRLYTRPIGGVKARGFPERNEISPGFREVQAWAGTIERISSIDDDRQLLRELEESARNPMPIISQWAIAAMAETQIEGGEEALRRMMADERFSVSEQISLDKMLVSNHLSARARKKWQYSDARVQMMKRWLELPLEDRVARMVWERFDEMAHYPGRNCMEPKQFLSLTRFALEVEEIAYRWRRDILLATLRLTLHEEYRPFIFDFAIQTIQTSEETEFRYVAAGLLSKILPFDDAQREQVQELQQSVDDLKLAEMLQEVLKKDGAVRPPDTDD